MAQVGFVGLGKMGRPMAANLMKAGHRLIVYNRSRAAVEALAAAGATPASDPADLAARSEVVFTCLPMPADVEAVVGAALAAAPAGTTFVDHSTIDPATARRLAARCLEKGCDFIDAPVSGGPQGAEAATLSIMCGGEAVAFQRIEPLLRAVGGNVWLVGPVGAGCVVKLVNQVLVGVHAAAAVEALALGAKAGVDPQVIYDIVRVSTGHSYQLDRILPDHIFARRFEPGFAIDLLLKDVTLAVELARSNGVRALLGAVTQQVLAEARALGLGNEDYSALAKPMERLAGIEVRPGAPKRGAAAGASFA